MLQMISPLNLTRAARAVPGQACAAYDHATQTGRTASSSLPGAFFFEAVGLPSNPVKGSADGPPDHDPDV